MHEYYGAVSEGDAVTPAPPGRGVQTRSGLTLSQLETLHDLVGQFRLERIRAHGVNMDAHCIQVQRAVRRRIGLVSKAQARAAVTSRHSEGRDPPVWDV